MQLLSLPSAEQIQNRLIADRQLTAILAGAFLGVGAAAIGLLLAIGGPLVAFGVAAGIGIGIYVITDMKAALFSTIAVVGLLPYATLPIKIALVPTILDCALGSFLLVYVFQWMTGKRVGFRWVPAHKLIILFIGFILFSFVAGLANGQLTTTILREFVEMLLAIGMALILPDVIRDEALLRRVAMAFILVGALQAAIALVLYVINPDTAERLLNTLGRFGYPVGGVVRYINDDPTLAERAVGTWVDPNAAGGYLMMVATLTGVQALSEHPVTGKRWIVVLAFGLISAAMLVTISRGAMVGLAAVALALGIVRYRWLLIMLILGGSLILVLPFTQDYIDHFVQGVTGEDLSTQMRLGEYKDALILVGRYPLIGVGFAGTPDRDIYLGVSMLYLKIAGATGLLGLAIFLVTMTEIFRYGLRRWQSLMASPGLFSLWLGFSGGLLAALVSGIFDHYYFNIEFHAAAMMFWMFAGLSLAAARLANPPVTSDVKSLVEQTG